MRCANLIANRTAALCEIAIILGQHVCVEQPAHPRGLISLAHWQRLCGKYQFFRCRCVQGAYGAETEKPTSLYANHLKWGVMKHQLSQEDLARLRQCGKVLATKKRNAHGEMKLTGVKEALKSTQSYTREFGRAIVDAWSSTCLSGEHGFQCRACVEGRPDVLFENADGDGYEEEPNPCAFVLCFCLSPLLFSSCGVWRKFTDFYGILRNFTDFYAAFWYPPACSGA